LFVFSEKKNRIPKPKHITDVFRFVPFLGGKKEKKHERTKSSVKETHKQA